MKPITSLPHLPKFVAIGLRSDILRRRADVQRAERQLAESTANIGVEIASIFPKFVLNGDLGTQANILNQLFNNASQFWTIAGFIQTPIFAGGTFKARVDAAKHQRNAALANYEKTVLDAVRDAETALINYKQELTTFNRLHAGVASRRKAASLAQSLFEIGEEDFLSVLDAERQLVSNEDDLVNSEIQTITKLVTLYQALGGHWSNFVEYRANKTNKALSENHSQHVHS
jgi:outer membrane protein, multidrug efflux system